MPTPIESAVRLAQGTLRALAAVDVSYRWQLADGTFLALPMEAIKNEEDVDVDSGDGTLITARITTFRIAADDLTPYGKAERPKAGDQIEVVVGGRRQVYALANVLGDACYEPTDPFSVGFKCHTKLVEET